jgi:hypothetical protein
MNWRTFKWLFLFGVLFFTTQNSYAQVSTTTFIDPCTKEVTMFSIPLQGGTTIFFLNQSRYFTAADVTSGAFSSWINQVYTQYRQTNPCSQQQGQVTQNQITSQIISSTVQSVVGSIMASAQGSATSGGNLNASQGNNNKKNGNNNSNSNSNGSNNNNGGSSSSSQGNSNGNQSSGSGGTTTSSGGNNTSQGSSTSSQGGNNGNTNNPPQGGSGTSQPPVGGGSSSSGGSTTGGSGTTGGGSTGNTGGSGGNTGGSGSGGNTGGSGGNTGGSGGNTGGSGSTGGSTTTGGGTTGGSGTTGTGNQNNTQQQGEEVGATTTMNNDAHNDNGSGDNGGSGGGKSGGGKSGGKSGSSNPMIISSDLTTAQNLDKSFTPILNLSMSRSSMTGLSSVGATAMIWANLNQFALSAKWTKLNYNKKQTIKYIHNVNLTGVYTYGNILGFVGYSGILNAGKWGVTGFNVSGAVSIIAEDKSGFYSPSITAFYTRPFKVGKKLMVSPELYVMSTPLVYSTKEQVTITDRFFSGFLGSGFDYQISKRFKVNLNYKANLSTNPEIPILSFFLIGSKVNL